MFKSDPQVFVFLESTDSNVEISKMKSDLLETGHDSKCCNKSQELAL